MVRPDTVIRNPVISFELAETVLGPDPQGFGLSRSVGGGLSPSDFVSLPATFEKVLAPGEKTQQMMSKHKLLYSGG